MGARTEKVRLRWQIRLQAFERKPKAPWKARHLRRKQRRPGGSVVRRVSYGQPGRTRTSARPGGAGGSATCPPAHGGSRAWPAAGISIVPESTAKLSPQASDSEFTLPIEPEGKLIGAMPFLTPPRHTALPITLSGSESWRYPHACPGIGTRVLP